MKAGAHDFVLKDRLARLVPGGASGSCAKPPTGASDAPPSCAARQRGTVPAARRTRQDIIFRYRLHRSRPSEYLSPAVETIVGYAPDELLRRSRAARPRSSTPRTGAAFEASWRLSDRDRSRTRLHRRRPGSLDRAAGADPRRRTARRPSLSRASCATSPSGTHACEQQLRQAERLDSLGHLAGGIAHDFNNLLGVITATPTWSPTRWRRTTPAAADVDGIRQAADRGAALTRQLLDLQPLRAVPAGDARPQHGRRRACERCCAARSARTSASSPSSRRDLPPVTIDRSQTGTGHGQPGHERPRRDAGRRPAHASSTASRPRGRHARSKPARARQPDVTDTVGMTSDVARAFEPFFTTKGPGKAPAWPGHRLRRGHRRRRQHPHRQRPDRAQPYGPAPGGGPARHRDRHPRTPENNWLRQVLGYWGIASSLVNNGALNRELFLEPSFCGEMVLIYAKVKPFLKELREKMKNDQFLAGIESVIMSTTKSREFLKRMETNLAARKKPASLLLQQT